MDLPVDLRLKVYERIPRIIKHTNSQTTNLADGSTYDMVEEFVLITQHVPTAILATYRIVHSQANAIVKRLLKIFIFEQEPRMIVDLAFVPRTDPLLKILEDGTSYHGMPRFFD
jgi:hypothetical protein